MPLNQWSRYDSVPFHFVTIKYTRNAIDTEPDLCGEATWTDRNKRGHSATLGDGVMGLGATTRARILILNRPEAGRWAQQGGWWGPLQVAPPVVQLDWGVGLLPRLARAPA